MNERINVTKTFLPNQQEYQELLSKSWNKNWITNRGELVLSLEKQIKDKFAISNMIATTNGTLPLQIAIKALGISGEVITTPFSYIATASSIFWEGCTPVFADINPKTLNIDPKKIEAQITSKTEAIIATHVFGNPCDIVAIETIAKKYDLKVIYDAAHCFGVNYKGKSIFEYGDVSTCSFHATKIFHTGEGGAIFTTNKQLHDRLYYHHNFGHDGPDRFHGLGINAKMSELQAAMGLAVFPYLDDIFSKRKNSYKLYQQLLSVHKGITFQKIIDMEGYNYSYCPVIFDSEEMLDNVMNKLNENNIFPRRYFNPSLNTVAYFNGSKMEHSEYISKRIICLPLYYNIKDKQVVQISELILQALKN